MFRRLILLIAAIGLIAAAPAAAAAAPPADLEIDAVGTFPSADGTFTSNLPDCASGAFEDVFAVGSPLPISTPNGVAHRVIDYSFECDGGEGGFVIRMIASFGPGFGETSHAYWRVTSSWGSMDGLHGVGTIEGSGCGALCFHDTYTGTYHFAP